MVLLNKPALDEIDKKIDSAIASQPLLSLPRDIALIHILRLFEDFLMSPRQMTEAQGPEEHRAVFKNGQDGMHFAVLWIFQHCPSPSQKLKLSTRESVYNQAWKLLETAMNYSRIWDNMVMLYNGRATGEQDSDGTIRLRRANHLAVGVDIANRFISTPDSPELRKDVLSSSSDFDLSRLLADVQARPDGPGRVKYHIPHSTFERHTEILHQMRSSLWELELEPSWDLGGYTVSQFRAFWIALSTLCGIHHLVCFSGIEDGALNSIVMLRQRKRWEKELSRRSGLDGTVVSTILNDLIYDPTLYKPGKKSPDVTYQPFFPLDSELLALSNGLVLLSNAERNMWDLVSIKRECLHAGLRNQKERAWLLELSPRLESYGLKVYGLVRFTYAGRHSDLDLLVLDSKLHFGLGCQLKWRTNPDSITQVKYTDAELQIGLNQVALSLQWLNSRSNELQRLTGLPADELSRYEFKAMVLSKNTIGSGWIHKPDIPIVNERLVHWILGDPHRRNLRTLWQVGEERRYLPRHGKHFRDEDIVAEFGGIRFLGEGLGMSLQDLWDPGEDIDLTGLT